MRNFESNGVSIEKTFISGGGSTVICRRILLFYQNVLKTILQTILKKFLKFSLLLKTLLVITMLKQIHYLELKLLVLICLLT